MSLSPELQPVVLGHADHRPDIVDLDQVNVLVVLAKTQVFLLRSGGIDALNWLASPSSKAMTSESVVRHTLYRPGQWILVRTS